MDKRFTVYYDKYPAVPASCGTPPSNGQKRGHRLLPVACFYFLFGFRFMASRRMKSSNNEVSVGSNMSHFPSW